MVAVQIAALAMALSATGETTLLDFSAPWCAPCRSMESTVAQLERAGYPVRRINIDRERHLASQYHVQNIPCFVLLVDGHEAGRLTGAVSQHELESLFARAGVGRNAPRGTIARAQSPDNTSAGTPFPSHRQPGPLAATPAPGRGFETSDRRPGVSPQELIQSSVRLTIADPQGSSYGSGTIIDAREGEALVLTCGHIFRDSQGKGQIAVDLCAPGVPQKLPGKLVSYDLANDVGLVSIKPGVPVRAAPLAPKGYQASRGDRVVTVGCNNGGPATAQQSTVTGINKFLGPANLQVAGLPVQGRSGGGLFTADGRVIGVCNAADPTDNEGLYAALAVVHEQLDKLGLTAIYAQEPPSGVQLAGGRLPGPAPDTSLAGEEVVPASLSGLDAVEPAALAQLRSRSDGAEVICIVRSLSNPQAKSEVIVLDRASPAFLQQLAADRETQQGRHLTSLNVRSKSQPVLRSRR